MPKNDNIGTLSSTGEAKKGGIDGLEVDEILAEEDQQDRIPKKKNKKGKSY